MARSKNHLEQGVTDMRFHRFYRQTLAVAGIAAALHPGAAGAQCEDIDSQWQRVEINLGSVVAPIVANTGQLADGVAFAAIGATGTGVRFDAGGGVGSILDLEHRLVRVGFEPVDVDGPAALAPTEPVWGITVYKTGNGPGALPAWGALEALGLWGGAAIEHRVTGRTWRMHLSGDAADLGRLAWRPTGIAEITAGEDSGDLRLTLEADAERQLILHPAIATLGEETQYLPFIVDAEGTIRLGSEVPEGAVLDTVMVLAPYYHDADAVADGRGGFLAAGGALDVVETGGASGRDVAVLRLDDDGGYAGMTILASSGDDRAAGIASRAGDAYLAGTAGAADFPLGVKGGGETWPAPFAVRLAATGELAAGGYLRPHGLDAARDVAVDAEGRVLVSGVATPGAKDAGGLELTAVLPFDDAATRATYAVARFDGELTAVGGLRTFEGAATELPLELRVGCDGLSVGLEALAVAGSCGRGWSTHTYPDPAQALVPPGTGWLDPESLSKQPFPHASWGFHALRWKQQSHFPPLTYFPPTVGQTPVGNIFFPNAGDLNGLEATSTVFPNDPPGIWQANTAVTGLEAAIGAAAYGAFWKSPTYLNLRLGGSPSDTDGAVVMATTFCAKDTGDWGPLEICEDRLGRSIPIDDFDALCVGELARATGTIRLEEVRIHQWYEPIGAYYMEEQVRPALDFILRFEQADPGDVYIGDPPVEARFAAGTVREAIDRQLAFMVEEVPAEITTFAGGKATVEPGIGLVRSVDR